MNRAPAEQGGKRRIVPIAIRGRPPAIRLEITRWLSRTFGCARKVCDMALAARTGARKKARREVARIHARIAGRRRDHPHRTRGLAAAIGDAAWRELRSALEYRARWYGREVIAVDRWFPQTMPLNVRPRTRGRGAVHDRDVNAARNLLAAEPAVSARGAGVRPQRDSSRTGRSAAKQETLRRELWESLFFRREEEVNPCTPSVGLWKRAPGGRGPVFDAQACQIPEERSAPGGVERHTT